ncbi:hypothetical protein B0H14DRAFT_2650023 [Mycena olivaceomarginata]|nr:hypothetical protein B0H14DRAFT_2650023 [Mycena olivaceomarginata]
MSSAEHERQFSGMVCGEVRSAVEVHREGHVGEHAERKAGMRGVDRTVSAEAGETSTKVRMELSGVRVQGHDAGVQAGEARWSRHARRAVRIRGGAPDAVLSVRGGGGCRPTSASMGKGGQGIGATKMDGWMRARGAWGSRTLSPGQGRAPGARSGVAAAVRHRRARTEHIRAGDACAGANEPGKASAGSGALQVTAGTLWGAVGTSTQWQRERDASEGALRHTWARYSGGGNRTSGTACEQGCTRRAERIRPREACADSGKEGGRERSWREGARGLEENCRPWKRCGG